MLRLGEPIEVSNANVEGLRLQAEPPGLVRGKFRLDTTDQKFDWGQLTINLLPVAKRENPLVPRCFVSDKINADLNEYRQEDKGG